MTTNAIGNTSETVDALAKIDSVDTFEKVGANLLEAFILAAIEGGSIADPTLGAELSDRATYDFAPQYGDSDRDARDEVLDLAAILGQFLAEAVNRANGLQAALRKAALFPENRMDYSYPGGDPLGSIQIGIQFDDDGTVVSARPLELAQPIAVILDSEFDVAAGQAVIRALALIVVHMTKELPDDFVDVIFA
jgi:hypothetical protein